MTQGNIQELGMNRARSQAIIRKGQTMPEVASEIGDALYAVADALNRLAGVAAWSAAAEHSESHGRQKEMAAVIFRFAKEGYFSTKISGAKVSEADQEMLDRMFYAMFPNADPKKLPRR